MWRKIIAALAAAAGAVASFFCGLPPLIWVLLHTPDLNERQDHSLTKGRPACSRILHDQSRNAYGGSSGKQAIQKPHASRFSAGERQGKQQRANQDQRNEAKGNDLKCGHSILSKEPHAFTPFLI